ncbi:hypothetical protein BDP27DRAFT_1376083 [Rhodocollybia butyracea]|uniref:Uncharacterized protein n=1 Tax=Rhodocollybia butyracea TaxID=206335 RepID=A0A9P5TVB4_9AGAR|nr:hypothetical protein BDP27DRAFT_1376083 [Rhodocollybia butyracea]
MILWPLRRLPLVVLPSAPLALQTTGAAPIKAKKILQDCVHKRVAKRGLIIAKSRCLAEVEKTWELVGEAMVLDKEEADKVLDVWTESVKLCALALLDGDEAQCILHKAHCALEKIIELGGQLAVLQGKLDKLLPTLRKARSAAEATSHHPVPMIPKDAEGQRSGPTPGHGLPFTSDLDNDNEEETDDDNEEEDASEDNDGHPTSGKLTKGRSNLTISMRGTWILFLALRSATNCALWTIQQKLGLSSGYAAFGRTAPGVLAAAWHSVQEDSMPKKLYRLEFWSESNDMLFMELEADEQGNVPLVTDVNGKVLAYVWDVSLWHQDFLEMDIGSDEGSDGNDEQEITPKSNKGKGKGKEREIALLYGRRMISVAC